ncbi:MAG: hypothetical protein KDB07_02360, partial [Planctomycetes bacterium]|nr:hypothetical protein [Planctomycetota bacterium]
MKKRQTAFLALCLLALVLCGVYWNFLPVVPLEPASDANASTQVQLTSRFDAKELEDLPAESIRPPSDTDIVLEVALVDSAQEAIESPRIWLEIREGQVAIAKDDDNSSALVHYKRSRKEEVVILVDSTSARFSCSRGAVVKLVGQAENRAPAFVDNLVIDASLRKELVVSEMSSVLGRVRLVPSMTTPSDYVVSISSNSDPLGTVKGNLQRRIKDDGSFHFEGVPPGVVKIVLKDDGRVVVGEREVGVGSTPDTYICDFEVLEIPKLKVRIVDDLTGEPIVGAAMGFDLEFDRSSAWGKGHSGE